MMDARDMILQVLALTLPVLAMVMMKYLVGG